jgi:hypothetical protein
MRLARIPDGWGDGHAAGADWATHTPPHSDVHGFPACENVQESGFPSDTYALGYWAGVWSAWCRLHGYGHTQCLATHACRERVRRDTEFVIALAEAGNHPDTPIV